MTGRYYNSEFQDITKISIIVPPEIEMEQHSISGANYNEQGVHDLATGGVTARVFLEQLVKNSTASRRLN